MGSSTRNVARVPKRAPGPTMMSAARHPAMNMTIEEMTKLPMRQTSKSLWLSLAQTLTICNKEK